MKVQTTIKEVFDYLTVNGFDIELNESCCSSRQSRPSEYTSRKWIRAVYENDDQMLDDINGEGSAVVSWNFGPQDKIPKLAETIVRAFTKKGYIVNWNKRMGGKITVVIEVDNLPISFLNKLDENIIETDFIEERVDPDSEVFFNKEEDERSIFSSSEDEDDEDEDDDDAKSEPLIDQSEEDDDDDTKSEPLIDQSEEDDDEDDAKSETLIDQSEEDEDTVCPEGCECVNCEEERDY
jgi:hypothetical protein